MGPKIRGTLKDRGNVASQLGLCRPYRSRTCDTLIKSLLDGVSISTYTLSSMLSSPPRKSYCVCTVPFCVALFVPESSKAKLLEYQQTLIHKSDISCHSVNEVAGAN